MARNGMLIPTEVVRNFYASLGLETGAPLKIAVDFDETLNYWLRWVNDLANLLDGVRQRPLPTKYNSLGEHWGVNYDEERRRIDLFEAQPIETHPIRGAIRTVRLLKDHKNRLDVLTFRPEEVRGTTWPWLERHFTGCFGELVMIGKQGVRTTAINKGLEAIERGYNVLIDDQLPVILNFVRLGRETGTPVLGVLFGQYSWNVIDAQKLMREGAVRGCHWRKVGDLLVPHSAVPA
jgi:hypothetical protein